jgi:hypothetical protein
MKLKNLSMTILQNYVQGEFQLKQESGFFNGGRQKGIPFEFFFARTKLIWTQYSLRFMSNMKAWANSSLEVLPRGMSPSLRELHRSYYFFCQLPVLA